jgi:regulator of sirC expression with transglutaminase-like and TPR domain
MPEPDVFEGAMRIARVEYPALDPARYHARLDAFAEEARRRVDGRGRRGLDAFNAYFFGILGFRGNPDDYYDPRNSYLNEVIDRRLGIPITLAVVWCEVAARLGFRVEGVSFPGHFLARALLPRAGEVLVDCFHARTVTRDDCRDLLARPPEAPPADLDEAMFAPAGPREILTRMLNNLRRIHASLGDFDRAVRWIDLDLELHPGAAADYRERGVLQLRLERHGRALEDLERYLQISPAAADAAEVRDQCILLRKLLSQMN